MALNFKSGFTGTATINGTEVPLKDWTVDPAIRIAETENSLSGGFVLADFSGGKRCTFSFLIDFDYDANPYGAPLALRINQTIVQVKLFLNGTAGIFWLFPSALVVGTPQGIAHTSAEMVNARINCMATGTFSYPGGVAP
jgi:hypothetical protein